MSFGCPYIYLFGRMGTTGIAPFWGIYLEGGRPIELEGGSPI
jgi:hypothetical protein